MLGALGESPGIVPVYSAAFTSDGRGCIVMRLMRESLAETLRREGPLDPLRVRDVGVAACVALGHAHARGVVHRDVKPANLLLAAPDQPVLVDFGLARRRAREDADHAERVARASVPSGPVRILAIEDEEGGQLVVAHAAEQIGAAVEHATSVRAALVALGRDRGLRLIVLDLGIPGAGNALAWAREVRAAAPPDARILVVSGRDEAAEVAAKIGAACLLKPHSIDTIADAMRAAIA